MNSLMRLLTCTSLIVTGLSFGAMTASGSEAATQYTLAAQPLKLESLESLETHYQELKQATDLYERIDLAEKLLIQVDNYLKAHPEQVEALLLRVKLRLALVASQSERGATAIDYWEFVSEVVDPILYSALADLQAILKLKNDKKRVAEAHYWMAQYYLTADEADQDLIDQELKTACEGGYQKACQELK